MHKLLGVLLGLGLLLAGESALADSTVPALPAATSLTTSTTYLAQGAATDTSLGFTTSVFDIAVGALTLKANGVTNAMLANQATTVNGTNCTLGSSCTVPAAAGTLTGGTLAAGVTASSLTSVGTLTGLTMGGTLGMGTNTISGNFTASGVPILSGLSAGTQVSCLGLDSGNHVVLLASACGSGGGGGTVTTTGSPASGNLTKFSGATSIVNGDLSGDVTTSGTLATTIANNAVTTAKINANAVTLAKQATNTVNSLQGFDGSGNAADVTVGSGLSLSGGTLTSSGGATGVGVQGGQSVSAVGDNATALPSGHYYYATNANMTAQRTHALPDSATQGVGDFMVMDTQQTVTATNQLCMSRAGSDTINGGTTAVCITAAGGSMLFHNDGAGAYSTGPLANISAPTDAQILVGKTGTPQNIITPVTMSGDCTITNAGVVTCTTTHTIASGSTAMGTSAISSATCATVVTATATNTATTDVLTASFNGDPTAVTGYVPLTAGMLTIIAYPTANTANFKVCNNTTSTITPGAITLNWRVVR